MRDEKSCANEKYSIISYDRYFNCFSSQTVSSIQRATSNDLTHSTCTELDSLADYDLQNVCCWSSSKKEEVKNFFCFTISFTSSSLLLFFSSSQCFDSEPSLISNYLTFITHFIIPYISCKHYKHSMFSVCNTLSTENHQDSANSISVVIMISFCAPNFIITTREDVHSTERMKWILHFLLVFMSK